MSPEVASALVGIPLSIFANLASSRIETFLSKHSYLTVGLDELFINAFITTIKEHNKTYDSTSKNALKQLPQKIKRNKEEFLSLFGGIKTVHNLNDPTFVKEFAQLISEKYKTKNDDLLYFIIQDCLHDYMRCFFAEISEKQFMSIVLTDLFECTSKLNDAFAILSRIDEKTTWIDQHYFRESLFKYYGQSNEDYRKSLLEYDDFIQRHYKELQLRGFTPHIGGTAVAMELEKIFVPLNISYETLPASECQSNLINKNESEPLLKHQRSVLLGKPGSGKSTLLKHIAVSISSNRESTNPLSKSIVPILFKVSDYAESYKSKHDNLHNFLCQRIEPKFKEFFHTTLLCSNALILIDGLDEVTDKSLRLRITDRIEEFMSTYPKCQCIITSRIIGYNEVRLRSGFEHFQLNDFNKKQIKDFSDNWIASIHKDWTKDEIAGESNDLFESIRRNSSVFKLATNPLLMTIIAMIYFKGRRLPNSRIQLYEFSTETFLESWVRLRVTSDSQLKSKEDIIEILSPLAYHMHKTKSNACIEESELLTKFEQYYQQFHTSACFDTVKKETREFIAFLREQAGFFYEVGISESGENLFSFMHLTFEEYFAGMYLANDFNNGGSLWKDAINSSRWTEILRLTAAHLSAHIGRYKTTEFINAIVEYQDDFPEIGRREALLIQMLSDDIIISDNCKLVTINKIVKYLSSKWATIDSFSSIQPLLRSNFCKDLWITCFSAVEGMNCEDLCLSALPAVISDYILLGSAEYSKDISSFLSKTNLNVLKHVFWSAQRTSSRQSEDAPELLLLIILNRLAEFSLDDTNLIFDFVEGLQNLKGFHENKIFNELLSVLGIDMLKKLIIISRCDVCYNGFGRLAWSWSNKILNEKERIVVSEFRTLHDRIDYREGSSRVTKTSKSVWFMLYLHSKNNLDFCLLEVDTLKTWQFSVWVSNFKDLDTRIISTLPIEVQQFIYSVILGKFSKYPSSCVEVFEKLKKIGCNNIYNWYLQEYSLARVNEDPWFEATIILDRQYLFIENEFGRFPSNALMKQFTYEPSPPMKGLILNANKKPISKELLISIREYALSAEKYLQLPAMRVLGYLVNENSIDD